MSSWIKSENFIYCYYSLACMARFSRRGVLSASLAGIVGVVVGGVGGYFLRQPEVREAVRTLTQTVTRAVTETRLQTEVRTVTQTATITVGERPKEPVKVRIAWHRSTLELMSAYAIERGYFTAEGLDVELVFFASGAEAVRAVIAGDVNGYDGAFASSLALAVSGGAPVKGVMQLIDKPLIRILVSTDSDIRSFNDLVGKKLGISRFGSGSHGVALAILNKYGIDVSRVTLVEVGGAAALIAALKNKQIDVAFVWDPAAETAIQAGEAKLLANSWDETPDLEPMILVFREDFIGRNPDVVKALARAYARALDAVQVDRVDLFKVAKALMPDVPNAVLNAAIDNALKIYSLTGGFIDTKIEGSLAFLKRVGLVKPEIKVDDLLIRGVYP
jgi:ABC-type nitrate/sulfonate/bicarbonate transport system substrate-binding protein